MCQRGARTGEEERKMTEKGKEEEGNREKGQRRVRWERGGR